jgi:Putative prokaryotic signal transducing protein
MTETFTDYNRLISLRSGLDPADAQMLKSVLNANGVEVFLNGENMGSLNFAVRTDIMVRQIDKSRADAVIHKIATMPRCQIPRIDEDGEERACAQCGSTRVHAFVGEVPTFIPGIRLAAVEGGGWFHCLQCGSHYRDQLSRFSGLPVALMWSASLGGFGFGLYWLIDWIKWL